MASVIRLAVAEAIRAETSGADQINLLAFLMCMTDTQLSVLRETDTSEFFVKFVRASKALRAGATAGPVVESTSRAGGIAGAPAAEHPRDQQAPSPTSSAPCKSVNTWWPACWLGSVTPLWQMRGGDAGSQQRQHEDLAAASTMPVSTDPPSVVSTHTAGATNSLPGSSPFPSKHLSTCRQRRSHCAGPPHAASADGTL
ncbi:hypothetical protein CHLRE_07g344260v5 [Chlamydomonas reinhardtii]|uniref:Uncharacterized protein n=1 Tax=Chlamydomonas reinhardtii TaxID=3055 RepID=A0A2K3DKS9_CHLRE|nr:uncharacterized protein CHLRE_07g344260v5 [Chlamydomonas reinhardtii]PNW81147.1 hypothetical protein CHLRE_07g344260v5 [Chlamydomonas reinhardtii]